MPRVNFTHFFFRAAVPLIQKMSNDDGFSRKCCSVSRVSAGKFIHITIAKVSYRDPAAIMTSSADCLQPCTVKENDDNTPLSLW